jgi:putative oxidoreductase
MNRKQLFHIAIALLILLFSYTAISKLLDQYRFVFQMKLSPFLLVKSFAPFWGWFIPLSEIVIVVGIFFEKTQKLALYLSLGLLLAFEIYIVGMLISGLDLPCACGGVIAFMSWKVHVLFNAFFLTINIVAIRLLDKERSAILT